MGNIKLKDYTEAIEFILNHINKFPNYIVPNCIIHSGHINNPGISDLDLIIGFDDNFIFALEFLKKFSNVVDKIKNNKIFFHHLPHIFPVSALKKLPGITYNPSKELKIIKGVIKFDENSLNKYQNLLNSLENIHSRIVMLAENLFKKETNINAILLIGHSLTHSVSCINELGANFNLSEFKTFLKIENIRSSISKDFKYKYNISEDNYRVICKELISEFFILLNWLYNYLDSKIYIHFSKNIDKYFYQQNIILENLNNVSLTNLDVYFKNNIIFIKGFKWHTKCIFENYFENKNNYETLFYDFELQKQIELRFSFLKGLHEFNFKNYNNAIGRTGFSPLIRGEEYNKRALFLS